MKPTRTKETLKIQDKRLALYEAPGKSTIDPSEFIPVIGAKKAAGGKVKLLRRTDLVPASASAALAGGAINFGFRLLDVFSSVYGTYYPDGEAYFLFEHSLLAYTGQDFWGMELLANFGSEQSLKFHIDPMGIGNYLRIPLGQTGDIQTSGCILSVTINSTTFNLNLTNLSFKHFDLVLNGDSEDGYDVEFALRFASNNHKRAICGILEVELYNSIRVFPTGVLQA